jgi:hypothetical protein
MFNFSTLTIARGSTTYVPHLIGIFTATTGSTGKAVFSLYPVRISATVAVGDGFCLAGGGATGTCWIQAQTSTGTPIAQASFVTA